MDEQTDITVRAAVNHTDTMAIAKNVATNGRLFSVMVAAAAIAGGHPALAVFAAIPVGLACLVDQIPDPRSKSIFSAASYLLAGCVALTVLVAVW